MRLMCWSMTYGGRTSGRYGPDGHAATTVSGPGRCRADPPRAWRHEPTGVNSRRAILAWTYALCAFPAWPALHGRGRPRRCRCADRRHPDGDRPQERPGCHLHRRGAGGGYRRCVGAAPLIRHRWSRPRPAGEPGRGVSAGVPHLIPAVPVNYSGGVLGSPWADELSSSLGCLWPSSSTPGCPWPRQLFLPGPKPGVVEPAPSHLAAIDDPADAD